jgi:hypothetical protein
MQFAIPIESEGFLAVRTVGGGISVAAELVPTDGTAILNPVAIDPRKQAVKCQNDDNGKE